MNEQSDVSREIGLFDLFAIAFRARKMVAIITAVALALSLIASVTSRMLPPEVSFMPTRYTARARVLITDPFKQERALSSVISESSLKSIADVIGVDVLPGSSCGALAIDFATSAPLVDSLASRFPVARAALGKTSFAAEYNKDSGVFVLSCTSTDPAFARDAVNYGVDWIASRFDAFGIDVNARRKAQLDAQLTACLAEIARLDAESRTKAASSFEAAALALELDAQKSAYRELKTQYSVLKVSSESDTPVYQILEKALKEAPASGPSRRNFCIIVTLLAFFAAIIAAYVIEAVRIVRKNPASMAKLDIRR